MQEQRSSQASEDARDQEHAGARERSHPGEERTHTVEEGDTLQTLAARFYGSATEWWRLYEANRELLGHDPNLPRPGLKLTIPPP